MANVDFFAFAPSLQLTWACLLSVTMYCQLPVTQRTESLDYGKMENIVGRVCFSHRSVFAVLWKLVNW